MPATPVPSPAFSSALGAADSTWIAEVRDALEDYPAWRGEQWTADGVNGVNTAQGFPVSVQFPKINGSSAAGDNTPLFYDVTAAQAYTVVDYPTAPGANQVQVNYDTGEFIFSAAPTAGHVFDVSYQTCKWRDKSILAALMDGVRALFPARGKTNVDTSIGIVVNQWDYQLPGWLAVPDSRIVQIEIADPFIPTEPFRVAPAGEERVGLDMLHLPWAQSYSPTARLRLTGWGPYLRLADLEWQVYNLPIYYALGVLLPKREIKRIREDTVVPLSSIGGAQPTLHMQTGDYWARRFDAALTSLKRMPGPSSKRPWASRYQRMRYS